VALMPMENPESPLFTMSCYSSHVILVPPDKNLLLHVTSDGYHEWVRHEVACVIVRRAPPDRTCHPIGSTLRGMAFRKRIV